MKSFVRDDIGAALPGWVVARVIVGLVLAGTRYLVDRTHAVVPLSLRHALVPWDGQWYAHIADHGYAGVPRTGLRFFPLYPLAGRYLRYLVGGQTRVSLVLIANIGALLYAALLHRLVRRETGDDALAQRAAWLVALVPPAFVLVFAYSEAVTGCLLVGTFLCIRRRHWYGAAACAFFAGLVRPSGVLVAVAVAIEAVRGWRHVAVREWVARVVAVVAPFAGMGAYLAWVGAKYHQPLYPLRVQNRAFLRGGFADPVVAVIRAGRDAFAARWDPNGLHFVTALVLIALVVVCARRWPASYSVFAALTVATALAARRLGSLERYGFAAFPVVLALASVTARRRVEQAVAVVSAVLMAGFAALAMLGSYVP